MKKAFLNWSGGKDSAFALYKARKSGEYEVKYLFTTVYEGKVPMHNVSVDLLQRQAEQIGIPLRLFPMEKYTDAQAYGEAMARQMEFFCREGIDTALFGDIWLQDVRERRMQKLQNSGISAAFPLWEMRGDEVLREFFDAGFRSVVTNIDGDVLERGAVGRELREIVSLLPKTADICGEKGEYHSFVFDGPIFRSSVTYTLQGVERREFADERTKRPHVYFYANLI